MTTKIEQTSYLSTFSWGLVPWRKVNSEVVSLRKRIFVASRLGNFKSLRSLQRLLIFSKANILSSIKKVTSVNKGRLTPGLDELVYPNPEEKAALFKEIWFLDLKTHKAVPVKRVFVPKPNGKLRPLGIPTITDRVLQQMLKNALEPEWEAHFESSSYGFRPARSVDDAINRIFLNTSKQNCRAWVVDADITGCFDNIDHNYLVEKIKHFPHVELIIKWLKSGVVDMNVFYETDTGTPQGSIISPLLANIALHGLEKELGIRVDKKGFVKHGDRSLVRYADDFIVLCYTKSDAEKARLQLADLLRERGLSLNEDKTRVCHITDGFDFLGFNIRVTPHDGFKKENVIIHKGSSNIIYDFDKTLLLIKPSSKSVASFKAKVKDIFKSKRGHNAFSLILELNPLIRGWANSKRAWHANRTFHFLDGYIFDQCWRWMHRTHPSKSNAWLKARYFKHKTDPGFDNKWVFHNSGKVKDDVVDLELLQLKWFKIERHIMIKNLASPLDPTYDNYFKELSDIRSNFKTVSLLRKFDTAVARDQNFICPVCYEGLFNDEKLHKHHITEKAKGGKDTLTNLIYLHLSCHYATHRNLEKWTPLFKLAKKSLNK
jgi:RNA-directed DNA polymerase